MINDKHVRYSCMKCINCASVRLYEYGQRALNFNWSSSTHLFLRPHNNQQHQIKPKGKISLFCRPLETNKQIPPWEFMIYDFIITCGGSAVAYGYRHHNSMPFRTTLDLTNYCPMIPISRLSLGGLLRSKIFHQLEHKYPPTRWTTYAPKHSGNLSGFFWFSQVDLLMNKW